MTQMMGKMMVKMMQCMMKTVDWYEHDNEHLY